MESSLASCAYSHFNQRRAVRVVPYSRLPTKQCPLVITGTDDIAGGRGLAEQRNCGAPGGGSRASRTLAQALSGTTVGGYRAQFTARRPSGESGGGGGEISSVDSKTSGVAINLPHASDVSCSIRWMLVPLAHQTLDTARIISVF